MVELDEAEDEDPELNWLEGSEPLDGEELPKLEKFELLGEEPFPRNEPLGALLLEGLELDGLELDGFELDRPDDDGFGLEEPELELEPDDGPEESDELPSEEGPDPPDPDPEPSGLVTD